MSRVPRYLMALAMVAAGVCLCWTCCNRAPIAVRTSTAGPGSAALPPPRRAVLCGSVSGPGGPVVGATVRWQGHDDAVVTGRRGEFELPIVTDRRRIAVSAAGHYIATHVARAGDDVRIALEPLPSHDDTAYAWVDPQPCAESPQNCGNCHERIHAEWLRSAHARSATNPRLRDLIEGRDAHGASEPEWHMRRDHPHGVAVCNACHAPTLEPADRHWESLTSAVGAAATGVHCDFCHKVQSIDTAHVGETHGRYGMRLLRPGDGRQVVFGPLDDTERADTAAAAFYRHSEYCASCHEGTIFGVRAYTTYSEWQGSPAGRAGRQCQDCHMAAAAGITNMAPLRGGLERAPATLSDHSLGGAANPRYEDAIRLTVEAEATREGVRVTLTIDASQVGHAVPTGFIDRHLVLLIDAFDTAGAVVPLLEGTRLPEYVGASLAGRPGFLFAKVLTDPAGRVQAPVWNASAMHADTRLDPNQPQSMTFLLGAAAARLRVQLLHRDFWESTRRKKRWGDDTTVLLDAECGLPAPPTRLLPRPMPVQPRAGARRNDL